ncbi:MAG: NAD(P)H-dependent glycerol-3-phosphate dehydrogenase [Negativicutes bacterium]
MKIAVLGAGSWGTAMAVMLGQKHETVILWARKPALAELIQNTRQNREYLPDIVLPDTVTVTSDLIAAVRGAEIVVLATPSHAIRETAATIQPYISLQTILVSAAKGLELGSLKRMSEVLAEELPAQANNIAVLSGPSHAEEVGLKQPTTTVVAAPSQRIAEAVQDAFMMPYFRVYTNPDVIGVEMGGALKNIIALGAGIADGMQFGDNAKAALMTRGLAEITRLGIAMKANPLTFAGLSGIGDLMVTCTSQHSRNRRAGIMLAQGKTVEEIQSQTNMVVEGIRSTLAAHELARRFQVEMPITEQLYQVLYQKKSPKEAVLELMMRGKTHEMEEVAVDPGSWKQK